MDSRANTLHETYSLLDEKTLSDLEGDMIREETLRLFPSQPWLDSTLNFLRGVRPTAYRTLAKRSCLNLLPSFVQHWIGFDRSKPETLSPTAYLDGMRGLAALFVFFCHFSYSCFVITRGYGFGEPGENNHILQLPIIRLFYSGPPMVCIFFVISGYALSLKPLKLLRSQSWEKFFTTMSSSIFRRGIRLFTPTTVSTFMVIIMLRLGFYEPTRAFSENRELLRNVLEYHPHLRDTFYNQFWDWVWHMWNFVHVWSWEPFGGTTSYDVHLWTIPVEFRCSLMLFLALIGLARVRTALRFTFLFLLVWFTYYWSRWEMVLFYSGMFLAELDIIRGVHRNASTSAVSPSNAGSPRDTVTKSRYSLQILWIALAIFSLYLMSQPDDDFAETPGWIWLSTYIPEWFGEKYRYYQCIGAMLFVLCTSYCSLLQKPFNTPLVQYFGKISYSLYLMHGPVIHVIGYRIEPWAWSITGSEPGFRYKAGFLLSSIFILPITIWAADLFWRAVDAPSVRFARWLETMCVQAEPS